MKKEILKDFDDKDLGVYDRESMPKKAINRAILPPEVLKRLEQE